MSTTTLHSEKKKTLVPQLRFQEFDCEWENKKLGKLGNFIGGGTPSTTNEDFWKGNIPWISSSDIYENDLHNINIYRYLNDLAIKESATKIIPKNSILLVSRVGVGKLAINKVELCTSQDFSNFLPLNDDSYFIGYYLLANKQLLVSFSQGTSIKGFTTNDIKDLKIAIPTLPEQQKIASFLSAVDEKIQQLTRKATLLEQYKKGVMQKLFSGKLRFKDENGKDYPDWEEKKLGEVCEIVGGGTPDTNISEYWGGEIQWFTPTEIKSDFVSNSIRTITELGLQKSSAKKLPIGTILLTTRATIGEVSIAREECSTNQGFQSLIVRKENSNIFIFNWIKKNKHELISRANGSTFPEISKSAIEKILLIIPCLLEQQKIANFLSGIDSKIEKVNQQLAQTQTFKKGLLQQLFV
jgi:type I restriction enzyme S subunit